MSPIASSPSRDVAAAARAPGWAQGIALVLPCTMAVMAVVALAANVPLMRAQFVSVPNADLLVNLVSVMPSIWFFLFAPVAGWLADRYGRRRLLLGGLLAYAAVGVAPAFLDTLPAILVTRAGVGVCEALILTASTTMICDYWQGSARERWLAAQTGVSQLAAIVIGLGGGLLAGAYGWVGPFYMYLSSLVLAVGVALYTLEPLRHEAALTSTPPASAVSDALLPWRRLLPICALTALVGVLFFALIIGNALALTQLGVTDPQRTGLLISVATLGALVGAILYWKLARLPVGALLGIEFVLMSIGFAGMGRADAPGAYAGFAFTTNVAMGMALPTLIVWALGGLPYEVRGRVNGIWQSAFLIGQFLSALVLTFLSRWLGGALQSFQALGWVAVGLALCTLIALAASRRQTPASIGAEL